jgi:4-hydroxy-3-methylbut-2-enyl diphosphate reductase
VIVVVAESAGFCFGVERAVAMAEDAAKKYGRCYTLGPLIHNRTVTDDLARRGVTELASAEAAPEGAAVIIRSHGIGRREYARLAEGKTEVIDATCPFVAKIHEIVKNAENDGRFVVIIGEPEHAEVLAIADYASDCKVFSTDEKLFEWLRENPEMREKAVSVVFQTTSRREIYNSVTDFIKKECTNAIIFDTICDATNRRQKETRELARSADAVVVIGGRESANTRRLYEIAREENPNVQLIEGAGELDLSRLSRKHTIAVTAGASTPACIIKEVKLKMFEETEVRIDEPTENTAEEVADVAAVPVEEERELTLDELYDASFKTIHTGQRVTGYIAAITPTEITVDLGAKQSGYIPISELTGEDAAADSIKIGDELEAIVMRVNDVEGTIMLSQRRLDAIKSWSDIEAAVESRAILEGVVTEENKGGVVVTVRGVRVFVPASRTGLPREAQMSELLKKKVRLIVTEVNQPRRRVVGSISEVTRAERAEKSEAVWAEIEDGKRYKGIVKSLTSYGAFVDIGGVDGMVHVSELSWTHIAKPADILKIGDELEVFVISFDKEKGKISLGHKDRGQNPWAKFIETCQVGDAVTVKVVKLMKFGAFAEIIPGVDGLIHVSQLADHRVEDPAEILSEGDVVDVKITEIDTERKKVSLSIKALGEARTADEEETADESADEDSAETDSADESAETEE